MPGPRPAVLRTIRRFLRNPRVIVGEVVAVTVVCVVMTLVPQIDDATPQQMHRFAADWPRLAAAAAAVQLDRIPTAPWFLALVGLALASLSLVLTEQLRVLAGNWRREPTEPALARAPYRAEFVRPSRGKAGTRLFQSGRVGYAGNALLHLGLVLCVVAGFGRMLVQRGAVIELVEGETLAAHDTVEWARQWGGVLSEPMALNQPLRFDKLIDERYPSGAPKALSAKIHLGDAAGGQDVECAVNTPLDIGDERMYLTAEGGAALLVETGRSTTHEAILLRAVSEESMEFSGMISGLELHLRAGLSKTGALPKLVHARVLLDGGLRYTGPLEIGQGTDLGQGRKIVVRDIRHWSQFRARRDATLLLAWAGLACGLLGALLIYAVTPVAWMIKVEAEGEGERVEIRMLPKRFVPLFRERFEALVQAEGGNVEEVSG